MRDNALRALVVAAFVTRLYALYATSGYLHPDCLFQYLEPAHRLVYGYGVVTWEYVDGIRPGLQPLFITTIFKFGKLMGMGVADIIFLNRVVMVAFSLGLLYVIFELARSVYGGEAAKYALLFSAFSGILWLWSADTNSQIPSTLFVTASLALYYRGWETGGRRQYLLSGLALGVAFMFRFDSLIFTAPLVAFSVASRKAAGLKPFFLGFASGVLAQGVVDYLTWGGFLHSPVAFVMHNLVKDKASFFGVSPVYYYVGVLGLHLPAMFVLHYAIEKRKGFAFLAVNALGFGLAYSIVPHKEVRYLIPMMPLFFIIAGRGLERAVALHGKPLLYGFAALTVIMGALVAHSFGFSANDDGSQAMRYVGRQADSTGVAYQQYWFETGGYTYLHKRIPMVYIAEETTDPMLDRITCAGVDAEHIGYQCACMGSVLLREQINYIVLDEEELAPEVVEAGFTLDRSFGQASVYRRQ